MAAIDGAPLAVHSNIGDVYRNPGVLDFGTARRRRLTHLGGAAGSATSSRFSSTAKFLRSSFPPERDSTRSEAPVRGSSASRQPRGESQAWIARPLRSERQGQSDNRGDARTNHCAPPATSYVPVPVSVMNCGLSPAVSLIIAKPFSAPVPDGLKVTPKVQVNP